MKKLFLLFILFYFFLSVNSQPQFNSQSYFQQQVNYKIEVKLNDADNTLDGFILLTYQNNSPDTLRYIWFHLWPNAYKNDKTAFSDQMLQNGRTDFYFSDESKRGYINRLDFKVEGITAQLENHRKNIDVAKLVLPKPLPPGKQVNITTPFHVKLPFNFSRGGFVDHSYQVTQWYPKPAVYDRKGWHAMPYLDQGEFYSEFGNYEVQITVPKNYVVAATGELQNEEEKKWLHKKAQQDVTSELKTILQTDKNKQASNSTPETKTLLFVQNNVHDFAWFADKKYMVRTDTLQLTSGIIHVSAYFPANAYNTWKNSIQFIKDAVRTRSVWLGEYPYKVVTAVEAKMGFPGGMEYPTITSISPMPDEKSLDLVIEHEVGHNWNYGILGSNEREHPWMDEGMNTYFDNRYAELKYSKASINKDFFQKRFSDDEIDLIYRTIIQSKKNQPIETPSEIFSEINYNIIAYYKASQWMKVLENSLGKELFDKSLHAYFNKWKGKHPYPEDFKKVVEEIGGKNADAVFALLNNKGPLTPQKQRKTKVMSFFSFRETDKYNYIFIAPAIGINYYDKLMTGALIHNYTLPANNFRFFAAPMYATGSKKWVGTGRAEYNWLSYGAVRNTKLSVSTASFSMNDFTDSVGNKSYLIFRKMVPSLKLIFREKSPRSTVTKYLQGKIFFINEDEVLFLRDIIRQRDIITYSRSNYYINQAKFVIENNRVLYPYSAELQAEQGKYFAKATFTGKYFLNYSKAGGMDVRFFAGKFFYIGNKTFLKQYATDRFHLNMTGPNGYEDYTYSNYFTGRNQSVDFASQQIMIRDGGFKVRTDLLSSKVGKTDNWLAALNFKTDIPKTFNPLQVLPFKFPLKIFLDIGTYAEAWKKNAATEKFLYDGGLQLSFFKDLVNFYIPLVYSKAYSNYFKSTITEKRFWKKISFSIDIQDFSLRKLNRQIPF